MNRAHWPTKENRRCFDIFSIFPAHAKNGLGWPQMGPGRFFPTNPVLADILGDMDFDFEKFYFFDVFGSQISGLGPAWAHPLGPGPGLGPPTWAQLGPTHLGPDVGPPTWARLL